MKPETYQKAIIASILKEHELDLKKHLYALDKSLEQIIHAKYPKEQHNTLTIACLVAIHTLELTSQVLCMDKDYRETLIEQIYKNLKASVEYYTEKFDKMYLDDIYSEKTPLNEQ